MTHSDAPYRVNPKSIRRVTLAPVVIGLSFFGLIIVCVFVFRSNATPPKQTGKDPFQSTSIAALESAKIITSAVKQREEKEIRFLDEKRAPQETGLTEKLSVKSAPVTDAQRDDIRAQPRALTRSDNNLDTRSLSATSVVAIPDRGALRARTEAAGYGAAGASPLVPGLGGRPTTYEALAALNSKDADPNMQQKKEEFLSKNKKNTFVLNHAVEPQRERELKTGSLIPATLLTAINSDLPGAITAQVSSHVYDTASGNTVLVPQGSRLFGEYDSQIAYGQSRVLAAWNRIVFPDGRALNLEVMAGSDGAGRGGFGDKVERHYGRLFGTALLMSIMSAGIQLSQPQARAFDNVSAQQTVAGAVGVQMGQTGMEVTRRNLNVQPTIVIRPGYRFSIIVNKDFVVPESEEE
jgi:type IV secretory pathway VirB10-like protein